MAGDESSVDFWSVFYEDIWEQEPHRNGHDLWRMFCMGGEL
jgi:hypothetical protein